MCWNRVVWFITISARAHSCLSIVARDVQLGEVLLCEQQQRHNVWGPVTQLVLSCHASHDIIISNVSCHATKRMMQCIGMHYLIWCNALCHDKTRITPWHAKRDAWCNCVMLCHTARDVTQTNIIKHVFCTHGGFCIEQTTVSWRTRIYAKNCNKCGKTLKIANNVEKHSYILPC